jgi:molybdopterin-guanine dinucleotide biosynthesis protein A
MEDEPQLPSAAQARMIVGVFAGGRGRRMGGVDKALLPAPDGEETLIARLLRLAQQAGLDSVVVGGSAAHDAPLADEPPGIGPIGGLCALLAHARGRPAIALACDLPYVSAELLARLAGAVSGAAVLVPRDAPSGKWQPLFARYDSARVLPVVRAEIARGTRSLQALLGAVHVEELALTEAEHAQLRDWDEPADMQR